MFSTNGRTPWLTPEIGEELHPYVVGVMRNIGCPSIQTGGVEDHVHILFRLSRTMSLAQAIEKVKTSTSKWLKTKGARDFSWQAGYGHFPWGRQRQIGSSPTSKVKKSTIARSRFKRAPGAAARGGPGIRRAIPVGLNRDPSGRAGVAIAIQASGLRY